MIRKIANTQSDHEFKATMSIITLNANNPNTPIKRHFARLDKNATMCCLQEICINYKEAKRLKVKT